MQRQATQRLDSLRNIFEELQQITQWLPGHLESATRHMYKAEALIEVLEIDDCGSVGGFDSTNPLEHVTGFNLYDRFLALCNKYGDTERLGNCCHFTVKQLGTYFKKVAKLRQTFNV